MDILNFSNISLGSNLNKYEKKFKVNFHLICFWFFNYLIGLILFIIIYLLKVFKKMKIIHTQIKNNLLKLKCFNVSLVIHAIYI
jgi:hypothetical protein